MSDLCIRKRVKQERDMHFLIFSKRKNGRINKNLTFYTGRKRTGNRGKDESCASLNVPALWFTLKNHANVLYN